MIIKQIGKLLNWLFPGEVRKQRNKFIRNLDKILKKDLKDKTDYNLYKFITDEMIINNTSQYIMSNDEEYPDRYILIIDSPEIIYDIEYRADGKITGVKRALITDNNHMTSGIRIYSPEKLEFDDSLLKKSMEYKIKLPELKPVGD